MSARPSEPRDTVSSGGRRRYLCWHLIGFCASLIVVIVRRLIIARAAAAGQTLRARARERASEKGHFRRFHMAAAARAPLRRPALRGRGGARAAECEAAGARANRRAKANTRLAAAAGNICGRLAYCFARRRERVSGSRQRAHRRRRQVNSTESRRRRRRLGEQRRRRQIDKIASRGRRRRRPIGGHCAPRASRCGAARPPEASPPPPPQPQHSKPYAADKTSHRWPPKHMLNSTRQPPPQPPKPANYQSNPRRNGVGQPQPTTRRRQTLLMTINHVARRPAQRGVLPATGRRLLGADWSAAVALRFAGSFLSDAARGGGSGALC